MRPSVLQKLKGSFRGQGRSNTTVVILNEPVALTWRLPLFTQVTRPCCHIARPLGQRTAGVEPSFNKTVNPILPQSMLYLVKITNDYENV